MKNTYFFISFTLLFYISPGLFAENQDQELIKIKQELKDLADIRYKNLIELKKEKGPDRNSWHEVDYIRSKRIFFDLMRQKFNDLQNNYAKDPLVTIGDLSSIFEKKPAEKNYYGDHVHYTNTGRAVIVKHMMNLLRDPVLIQAQQ